MSDASGDPNSTTSDSDAGGAGPEQRLQLDDFAGLVGEAFVADFGDQGTLDLELIEAVERPTGNEHDMAFSLLFRGPADRVFDQGLVPLVHETLGRQLLFLVPVAERTEGREYEAIFTRVLES